MNHDLHTGRPERRPVGTIAFPGGADFAPEMTPAQVGAYSTLALAHIGDGVYELMMRTALCAAGLIYRIRRRSNDTSGLFERCIDRSSAGTFVYCFF